MTSGMFTYTNDERFTVLHAEGSDDWTLKIKYVQKRDNGTYECQVSEKQLVDTIFHAFFAVALRCIYLLLLVLLL